MGRLDGKVALITGAGRGQGRAHAVRLAEEGADIIVTDLCAGTANAPYQLATSADLEETAAAVRALGRQVVARKADVRSGEDMRGAVEAGLAELGRLDIVVANAGLANFGKVWELTEAQWSEVIDVNLTGVWQTVRAAVPPMIEAGRGGAIIIISSTGGLTGVPNAAHYVSSKHAVVGLMRALANEVGRHWIRVNTVHPTGVNTPLLLNEATLRRLVRHTEQPTEDDLARALQRQHLLPVPWVESIDVSNAVLWLASDEARYVTGVSLPVDAGFMVKV